MKTSLFLIAGSLLVSSLAVAQPEEPAVPETVRPVALEEPPAQPEPQARPIVLAQPAPPPAETGPTRPPAFSIGVGFGYRLPTEIDLPNATSVRVRLRSGLTFEPFIGLANDSLTSDAGADESEDVNSEVALGARVRYPMRSRGRADLTLVGGATVGLITENPDGDSNTTKTTLFGLEYGVAIDYWLSSHWNLSLTGTNPILNLISESGETAGGDEIEVTRRQIGLIFSPRVAVMIHAHL